MTASSKLPAKLDMPRGGSRGARAAPRYNATHKQGWGWNVQERRRAVRTARRRARGYTIDRRGTGSLTIDALENALGVPVDDWDAYETALTIIEKRLSDGVAVRGYWTGPVAEPDEVEADDRGRVAHAWILTPTGRILDPLRWLFEDAAPYVYEGMADYYDATR